jgi:hypothetical protein
MVGVLLTTLSIVHTPLPQPDFHNIRHHDAPGEVCEFHDHLLRWHPGAGLASDVSVLHWHWFLPSVPDADGPSRSTDDGPAIHAHVIDWQAVSWEVAPNIAARTIDSDTLVRSIARPLPCSFDGAFSPIGLNALALLTSRGTSARLAFSASFAPGVSLGTLLHRWDC